MRDELGLACIGYPNPFARCIGQSETTWHGDPRVEVFKTRQHLPDFVAATAVVFHQPKPAKELS